MVIDDDSSTCALLTHRPSAELAEFVAGFHWPVDLRGQKIPKSRDVRKLQLDHCFDHHILG